MFSQPTCGYLHRPTLLQSSIMSFSLGDTGSMGMSPGDAPSSSSPEDLFYSVTAALHFSPSFQF